jgi:hypothetical protein
LEPLTFEPGLAGGVSFELVVVAAAVEFDHEPAPEVEEVDDVAAEGRLTSKLLTADATGAKLLP